MFVANFMMMTSYFLEEESNAEFNCSCEDCIVVSGLPGPTTLSSSHTLKKQHYTDVLTRLITIACASTEHQPVIVDIYVNLCRDQGGQTLVEAKLDTFPGAQLFRLEGACLAKAKHMEFGSLLCPRQQNKLEKVT